MGIGGCGTCGGNRSARVAQRPSGMVVGYVTILDGRLTGQYSSWGEALRSGKGDPKVVNMVNGVPSAGALRALGVET